MKFDFIYLPIWWTSPRDERVLWRRVACHLAYGRHQRVTWLTAGTSVNLAEGEG